MLGIARYRRAAVTVGRRQHAAADAAIGTGRARGAKGGIDHRHLNIIGSRRLRWYRERPAGHHILADSRDRLPVAYQFKMPERVPYFADQSRAGEPAVRYHQLLV